MPRKNTFPLLPLEFDPAYIYDHPLREFNKYKIPIVHSSEFRVPCPGTPQGVSRSSETDQQRTERLGKNIEHWRKWINLVDDKGVRPNIIKLRDITLEDLGNRPRSDKNFEEASEKMEEMIEQLRDGRMQPIQQSCSIVDKDGTPLLYLFSHGKDRGKKRNHGLAENVLDDFQANFQHFASQFPPTLPKSDKRHREIPWMEYLKEAMDEAEKFTDWPESEEEDVEESRQRQESDWYSQRLGDHSGSECAREDDSDLNLEETPASLRTFTKEEWKHTGRTQRRISSGSCLAPARTSLGKSSTIAKVHLLLIEKCLQDSNLLRSTDSWGGSSTRKGAVDTFMNGLKKIHAFLGMMFKEAEPKEYAEYNKILKALKSGLPDTNMGAWLGFALLWKAQVHLHRDKWDGIYQWCATFNAGQYQSATGLEGLSPMLLPDLGIAIAYLPGDVLLFRSGSLYHAVAAWEARAKALWNPVTPGRIAMVCFTPHFTRLVYEQRRDGKNKAGKMELGEGSSSGYRDTKVIDE